MFVTSGTVADCKLAGQLIEGVDVDYLLADRAYDTNEILQAIKATGAEAVIPPKKNRKEQRWFDKEIYRLRHLVENALKKKKKWRGIATRYAKNSDSFLAAVHVRCLSLWLEIS
jgi:transposase